MTAQAEIIPPSPAGADGFDAVATYGHAGPPARRYDGWTAERQRIFLRELSEGGTVTHACRIVGLSVQSAYAFRRAARGASFAIGWQAAQLLARETLADNLMDRALNGIVDTIHHRDGTETTRHRHDCHFAFKMLSRMDRMANAAHHEATHAAARLVAGEFEQYLEMIGQDGGPIRAGLFLGARVGAEGVAASDDDLAPVRVLARADHWLRTHKDLAEPLATADLDPARRGEWTAEQWARAEAAGLVQLAPPPPPTPPAEATPEVAKLHQPGAGGEAGTPPVWWDEAEGKWRTRFPPPPGFYGDQDGDYGDFDYSRELTNDEEDQVEAPHRREVAARRIVEADERNRFFAALDESESAAEAPAALADPPAGAGATKHSKAAAPG